MNEQATIDVADAATSTAPAKSTGRDERAARGGMLANDIPAGQMLWILALVAISTLFWANLHISDRPQGSPLQPFAA